MSSATVDATAQDIHGNTALHYLASYRDPNYQAVEFITTTSAAAAESWASVRNNWGYTAEELFADGKEALESLPLDKEKEKEEEARLEREGKGSFVSGVFVSRGFNWRPSESQSRLKRQRWKVSSERMHMQRVASAREREGELDFRGRHRRRRSPGECPVDLSKQLPWDITFPTHPDVD
jgi:hypothetical protein